MLSIGDVQGCLRKLETLLRVIKFPGNVDYSGLSKGEPSAFLPIVSFTLTSFSPLFAEQLMADGLALAGKTDLRFTDTLFKILRDVFHYKPVLTKQQFLQWGFSQRKISFICDIINLVLQKHNQLVKAKVKHPASHKNSRGEGQPTLTGAFVSKRGISVNCIENPSSSTTNLSHTEVIVSHNINCIAKTEQNSSSSPEKVTMVAETGVENTNNIVHLSEVKGRLLELETKLESVLCGLGMLSIMEKRLDELERRLNTNKNEGQNITICRESWENLMSRVLLLETKLELSHKQVEE